MCHRLHVCHRLVCNSACCNCVNFIGATLGCRDRRGKNVVGIVENLLTGFMFVVVEACGSVGVCLEIIVPVTISRLECDVGRSDQINTRDVELSMCQSIMEIAANIT